jgi:hypothetical protein
VQIDVQFHALGWKESIMFSALPSMLYACKNIMRLPIGNTKKKIAKHSNLFGEGEFIKECLWDVASIICHEKKKRLREYLFVETYCCPTDRNDDQKKFKREDC